MSPRPGGGQASHLRSWLVTLAVLWPVLFLILGTITGDFDGAGVARSFLIALAISAGLVLGRRGRRQTPGPGDEKSRW